MRFPREGLGECLGVSIVQLAIQFHPLRAAGFAELGCNLRLKYALVMLSAICLLRHRKLRLRVVSDVTECNIYGRRWRLSRLTARTLADTAPGGGLNQQPHPLQLRNLRGAGLFGAAQV